MKRTLSLLFIFIIICLSVPAASAIDYGCDVDSVSDTIYLEELTTGTVIYEQNASQRIYPASTTKIMTFIVVAENVHDLDGTMVEVTDEALENLDPESSVMGLTYHIGESFSVRDLLYGLMLPSGNDAALVLAEYVGKSQSGFVDMMNRKAAQLSCKDTHFTSPHGLHDSQHYTTAHDMATITKYAMRIDGFMEICNTVSYLPNGFDEEIRTTNYLLDSTRSDYYYPATKGIKTGYTDQAGKCLISTAEKDGYRYLCIAMGADYSYAEDVNYAMLDTIDYYDWAFDNLSRVTVYDSSDVLRSISVEYVWGNKKLDLVPESAVTAFMPKDYDKANVTIETKYKSDLATAPVSKGDTYGTLLVKYNGELIGTTNIVAAETIERDETNYAVHQVTDTIEDHLVLFIILLLALIVGLIFLIRYLKRKKARNARRGRSRIRRDDDEF